MISKSISKALHKADLLNQRPPSPVVVSSLVDIYSNKQQEVCSCTNASFCTSFALYKCGGVLFRCPSEPKLYAHKVLVVSNFWYTLNTVSILMHDRPITWQHFGKFGWTFL